MNNGLKETARPDNEFSEELTRRIDNWNQIISADIPTIDADWAVLNELEVGFLEARMSGDWDTFQQWLDRYEAKLRSIREEFLRSFQRTETINAAAAPATQKGEACER